MDKYRKLKAVQGLIVSLDEQIYRFDQIHTPAPIAPEEYSRLIQIYYDEIVSFLIGENSENA